MKKEEATLKLNRAKEEYKVGTKFLSVTERLEKFPLTVRELRYAFHEDRFETIKSLEKQILDIYRLLYPGKPKDAWIKLFKPVNVFEKDEDFYRESKSCMDKLKELKSLGIDIVNSEGGVIYCGTTNTWAKRYEF